MGRRVGRAELFLGFLKIGMLGFGGVAPYARHIIVEERGWLTELEFAETLGLGQILPGANTINAAVLIGDRFRGVSGVAVCLLGLMAVPLVVATLLSIVYDQFAGQPAVNAALTGAASAAAGLVLGTGLKMAVRSRPKARGLFVIAAAVVSVGIFQAPLVPILLILAPVSILLARPQARP